MNFKPGLPVSYAKWGVFAKQKDVKLEAQPFNSGILKYVNFTEYYKHNYRYMKYYQIK